MSKTIILISSLGKNVELAAELEKVLVELGAENKTINLVDLALPLYSSREEANGVPEAAKKLTEEMINASSFIIVAPEYNGSMPAVLINAVSWVSRSGGDDWRAAFNGKYAVVATHSGGGGVHALQAMRAQWEYLGCTVLARGVLTNYQKPLKAESAKAILGQLISL